MFGTPYFQIRHFSLADQERFKRTGEVFSLVDFVASGQWERDTFHLLLDSSVPGRESWIERAISDAAFYKAAGQTAPTGQSASQEAESIGVGISFTQEFWKAANTVKLAGEWWVVGELKRFIAKGNKGFSFSDTTLKKWLQAMCKREKLERDGNHPRYSYRVKSGVQ